MSQPDVPLTLQQLETPALLLDSVKLRANLTRMARQAERRGVLLRPHLKTAKAAEVAMLATAGPHAGITVSTLREAEFFAGHGFNDILYAVGITPAKLARAAQLLRDGVHLRLLTDDVDTARRLAAEGRRLGVRFDVLIEIDCGDHRCGVPADSDALLAIARALSEGTGARCLGVCTHAGQSYDGRSLDDMRRIARVEIATARAAADRLRTAGHAVAIVSVGSSPTALHGDDFTGITELRCGVYMFGDLFQAGIGTCTQEEIALTVLAAVIGRQPARNCFFIDAGALALSKDRSTERLPAGQDAGFGLLLAEDGRTRLSGLRVSKVSQEHGLVESDHPIDFAQFPVGRLVRVLPNHACLTAAAYHHYHITEGGDRVVGHWPRANGW